MSTVTETTFSLSRIAFEVVEQGTIRIGGTRVSRPGEAIGMSDRFDITTLEQVAGEWKRHPVEAALPQANHAPRRVIPITIPYDDPDLVIQSRLTAFDRTENRVVCRGTTEGCARRREGNSVVDVICSGPEECSFASSSGIECKWFGRMRVHVDAPGMSDDPTQVFVLRSAGYNTLRGLEASLRQYHALFGKRLRGVKFKLTMRTGTSATSEWNPYEFVELSLNEQSVAQAMSSVIALAEKESALGLNMAALEDAVRAGLENSEFSRSSLEGALASEFFPVQGERPAAMDKKTSAIDLLSGIDLGIPAPSNPAM